MKSMLVLGVLLRWQLLMLWLHLHDRFQVQRSARTVARYWNGIGSTGIS